MQWTIGIVQFAVTPGDPVRNQERAEAFIRKAAENSCDLVCLPEMWTTGFYWEKKRELADRYDPSFRFIAGLAEQYQIRIAGSVLAGNHEGNLYNRFLLLGPGGEHHEYDKVHLFKPLGEQDHLEPGTRAETVTLPNGLRIAFAICYDLRFPELFRRYALQDAELVLLVAAFPHPRLMHWQTLTRARAMENQFFVVAVNRAGTETVNGETVRYCGASAVYGPNGETVAEIGGDEESMVIARIDTQESTAARARIPAILDRCPEIYNT